MSCSRLGSARSAGQTRRSFLPKRKEHPGAPARRHFYLLYSGYCRTTCVLTRRQKMVTRKSSRSAPVLRNLCDSFFIYFYIPHMLPHAFAMDTKMSAAD